MTLQTTTIPSAMAGTSGRVPPSLSLPFAGRPSSGSLSSSNASPRSQSPDLSTLDSSAALILVHDDEEEHNPFHIESEESEDDDEFPSQYDVRKTSIPPLRPSLVFLYLLAPYLKLGAMFLLNTELPLEQGLPPLIVFALLSAFSRQLWFMLGRYIRKLDMEDVILDAFARGRGKERRRSVLRSVIRAGTGGLRVLITAVYLRESTNIFLSIFGEFSWAARLLLTAIITVVLLPLIFAQSIASKSVVYSTWLSIFTYVAWLGFIVISYIRGISLATPGWLKMGAFWQGIATISFAFTTTSTLSLYSSLRGHQQTLGSSRASRKQSFKTLSILSVLVSIGLTLPLVFFAAYPRVQDTQFKPSQTPIKITTSMLTALTLLLNIPAILITSPSFPIPDRMRHTTSLPISRLLLTLFSAGLSILPDIGAVVLSDILLLSAFTSTYFLPALIHVTTHFFKRPLAIVVPQTPRGTSMNATSPLTADTEPGSATRNDELLLRKEHALQRKQWKKRILWDLGVWVLLLGGGAGFIWAIGRVVGRW